MRVLYTSDLHGSPGHYAKLLNVAETIRPDLVVLGGDLFPDDSALKPQCLGQGQPEYIRTQFRKNMESLRQSCGCKNILMIFGNHDWGSCVPAAQELSNEGVVTLLDHKQSVTIDGLSFLGYPCTPPTPWFVKDFERLDMPGDRAPLLGGARWDARFSRPVQHGAVLLFDGQKTIAEELEELVVPSGPWIFVVHAPPLGTHLDQAYGEKSFGSKAIREAIERHQPLLSLHGHIHESPTVTGRWRDELGKTIAINPGQSTQYLSYAVIDVDIAGNSISKLECGQQS